MRNRSILTVLGFSFLLGLSPLAADPVIQRGVDVFTTIAGEASYDFAFEPIPAGFFCKRSAPFTGKVTFRGVPLATDAPGKLWGADTVIERLDDAAFNEKGVAQTRIRFRALSLASVAPIKTACGNFHVYVSLAGPQRVTTMKIRRTEEGGGTFAAPLAVDARMTFIPVKPARAKAARKLELLGSFTFPAQPLPWSLAAAGPETKRIGAAVVDTDGDLTPDTRLPGASNFLPGQSPDRFLTKIGCPQCLERTCHRDPSTGKIHCTTSPVPSGCYTPTQYCFDS